MTTTTRDHYWFREQQKKLELSNSKMAKELGVSETMVYYLRNGQRKVSKRTEKQIQMLFEMKNLFM